MNGYDFLASIVASAASLGWPIAIFASVYLFRQRLNEILHRLQLKHKDTVISFQIETAKADADADADKLQSTSGSVQPTAEENHRFTEMAKLDLHADGFADELRHAFLADDLLELFQVVRI